MVFLQVNFNHLKAFFSVAKNKSFTLASKELNLSQSTLSVQIQQLEYYYHCQLLNRKNRPLQLTEEGRIIYAYAQRIFNLAIEMDSEIHDLNILQAGSIKIGTTRLLASYVFPDIIYALTKKVPRMKIHIHTDQSIQILQKVLDLDYHIGVQARASYPKNIIFHELSRQIMYFISAKKFDKRVTLEDLAGYPIIFRKEGSITRDYIIREFQKRNITFNTQIETENPSAIKRFVQMGLGGAFFPAYAIAEDVKAKRYFASEVKDLLFPIDIIYLRERRKSASVQILLSKLKAYSWSYPDLAGLPEI
jgi:DNA-binding transcriptional LysR family regulator